MAEATLAEAIMAEESLPETTPMYRFQSIEHCLRSFDLEIDRFEKEGQGCGYVVFTHVDHRAFRECFEDSKEKLLTHACKTYNFTTHVVVLKMPSSMHECAHRAFSIPFDFWQRGQSRHLDPMGATEVKGFERTKCPDSSWGTKIEKEGRDPRWPTIVVEVGWTERTPFLQKSCLFWLRESEGAVRVALSLKIYASGEIKIQQWSLREDPVRVESTQQMTIVRKKSPAEHEHEISGSLTIPFEDAYLCQKSPGDIDFELTHDDLREIADVVWRKVDMHKKDRARKK